MNKDIEYYYIIKRIGSDNIYSDYYCGLNGSLDPIFKITDDTVKKYNKILEAEKHRVQLENLYFNKGFRNNHSFTFYIIKNRKFSPPQKIISRFELMEIE